MKKLIFYTIIMIVFSACSFKTPENEWKIKSVNAFDSYTQNFLKSNDTLAKNDLKRAIKHAKNSANLDTLGGIYLSECALNISVGIDNNCSKFVNIQDLIYDKNYNSYKDFILGNFEKKQISSLPKNYHEFAKDLIENNYEKANQDVQNIKNIKSKLIAAAILKENINKETIKNIIKNTSHYGYKKAIIYWLTKLREYEVNDLEKKQISKRLLILKSK